MTGTDTKTIAATIGQIVSDALWLSAEGDETVANISVRKMADGTDRWAVFTSTYDADLCEHDYRAIINHDLTVDAEELN